MNHRVHHRSMRWWVLMRAQQARECPRPYTLTVQALIRASASPSSTVYAAVSYLRLNGLIRDDAAGIVPTETGIRALNNPLPERNPYKRRKVTRTREQWTDEECLRMLRAYIEPAHHPRQVWMALETLERSEKRRRG